MLKKYFNQLSGEQSPKSWLKYSTREGGVCLGGLVGSVISDLTKPSMKSQQILHANTQFLSTIDKEN